MSPPLQVQENSFIRELYEGDPTLKERADQRMVSAEERRKSHESEKERRLETQREKGRTASERLLSKQRQVVDKGRHAASQVDEAYDRWTSFNLSVAERAASAARSRQEVASRRELAQQEEAAEKRRALEQRFAEANERRLAHIHMLMQQARVASERSAQAQQFREARRTTWADESSLCSTTDGGTATDRRSEASNDRLEARDGGGKKAGGRHGGKHAKGRRVKHARHDSMGSDGCSGDERSDSASRRTSTGMSMSLGVSDGEGMRAVLAWRLSLNACQHTRALSRRSLEASPKSCEHVSPHRPSPRRV